MLWHSGHDNYEGRMIYKHVAPGSGHECHRSASVCMRTIPGDVFRSAYSFDLLSNGARASNLYSFDTTLLL